MARVTGIGGIFLKAEKPSELSAWYAKHLGLTPAAYGGIEFEWTEKDSPGKPGKTVWALFPTNTEYFGAGEQQVMVNYRVDHLEELLHQLEDAGGEIDLRQQVDENGRFAWIIDPEGNRIELWEPPEESANSSVKPE